VSDLVQFRAKFTADLVYWRGPSPFHFLPLPPAQAAEIHLLAPMVTYGWGVIPVRARIGASEFTTSLFPKEGGYLLPVKDKVRKDEGLSVGDKVKVEFSLGR
jgi:hypothetical protein